MSKPEGRHHGASFFDLGPVLRVATVVLMVLFQFALILFFLTFLRSNAVVLYAVLEILCALVMVYFLAASNRTDSYKIAWVTVVMLLGVFGLLLYILWGRSTLTNPLDKRLKSCLDKSALPFPQEPQATLAFKEIPHDGVQRIGRYLRRQGFPVYAQTASAYYPLGELAFDAMLEDLRGAKQSIYIEFFIIFSGAIWERFFEVLSQKAQEGLDVRLMYDDMGSLKNSTGGFVKRMTDAGIQVGVFNPVHRHVHQMYLNYRNHQKILVVDQRVAYTGGINLSDEYANLYPKHGHWKDTAVRLEGPAVEAFTRFFLMMWNAVRALPPESDLQDILSPAPHPDVQGFIQPFEDGPHNNPDNPAEVLYRQIIADAQHTLYITTPYLVIDELMVDALCIAAASGVDVRLIIPQIPDHWYVHWTSLSFAGALLKSGVRIYHYTPGYIHAKMVVADDLQCIVGTVNMDYRSFYLHYECGAWFVGGDMPSLVRKDIDDTLAISQELTLEAWKKRPLLVKAVQPILRVFAPLM